jgi:hypothetical protein
LIDFHADQRFELYNTENDLGETQNLFSPRHPVALKLAKELGRALKKGRAEMPKVIATQRNVPYPDDLIKMRAR